MEKKHKFKIGSHNSMTYLPPKKWYMYPFKFVAKCQSSTIEEQYEKYSIRVTNNTKNTIMINRKEDNDGIYTVYSGSSEKYSAFISEIYEQNLTIEANQTKYLSIRINKLYTGDSAVKKMVFSDIIKNKKEFEKYETKSLYTDVSTIEMNF